MVVLKVTNQFSYVHKRKGLRDADIPTLTQYINVLLGQQNTNQPLII